MYTVQNSFGDIEDKCVGGTCLRYLFTLTFSFNVIFNVDLGAGCGMLSIAVTLMGARSPLCSFIFSMPRKIHYVDTQLRMKSIPAP